MNFAYHLTHLCEVANADDHAGEFVGELVESADRGTDFTSLICSTSLISSGIKKKGLNFGGAVGGN